MNPLDYLGRSVGRQNEATHTTVTASGGTADQRSPLSTEGQRELSSLEALVAQSGVDLTEFGPQLKDLAQKGRLWVDEGDALRRASGPEAALRLLGGEPVVLVTKLIEGKRTSSHSERTELDDFSLVGSRGLFESREVRQRSERRDETVWIRYAKSTLSSPDLLKFLGSEDGIAGVAFLPARGTDCEVQISHSFSASCSRYEDVAWGILIPGSFSSADQNSLRQTVDVLA